jgi:hypothetical protein
VTYVCSRDLKQFLSRHPLSELKRKENKPLPSRAVSRNNNGLSIHDSIPFTPSTSPSPLLVTSSCHILMLNK